MKVVVADVLPDALDERTVQKLVNDGIDATGVVTDVTDFRVGPAPGREVAQQAYGTVHVVCNNAGTGGVSEGYMWEHDLADWRWGLDVNVLGVIHGIKAFVPILLAQTKVTSSTHALATVVSPLSPGAPWVARPWPSTP